LANGAIARLEQPASPDQLANGAIAELGQSAPLAQVQPVQFKENPIPQGQRNDTLTSLAGTMRRRGMSRAEIAAALHQVNKDRCKPPLDPGEVDGVATSVARYTPDQIATAMAEGHWEQMIRSQAQLAPLSLAELVERYPNLRRPVIHGLLRQGETMNVIAAPKTQKSWLVTDLALAVATGRPWLDTFETDQGNVLIIDNELHPETSANRIPRVAAARQIALSEVGHRVFVQNLRGHWQDIFSLGQYFRSLKPGQFRLIILDAMYRFMPQKMDENDNATMANIYNAIDRYADLLGCCFVLIHHTSKGNQSGKSITDVGAGAGSQSRATDTHLILRPHEEDDVVVLEAAVRSWPPVMPRCLRWTFPVWTPADDLDPTLLRSERPRRARKAETEEPQEEQLEWTIERFVSTFVGVKPKLVDALLAEANQHGLSDSKSKGLLRKAEAVGLVYRWGMSHGRLGYATQAPPTPQEGPGGGIEISKRRAVLELIRANPEMSTNQLARLAGASVRWAQVLRREVRSALCAVRDQCAVGVRGECAGSAPCNSHEDQGL
jgi:hypothetical protein